jgi:hypothetical protein
MDDTRLSRYAPRPVSSAAALALFHRQILEEATSKFWTRYHQTGRKYEFRVGGIQLQMFSIEDISYGS